MQNQGGKNWRSKCSSSSKRSRESRERSRIRRIRRRSRSRSRSRSRGRRRSRRHVDVHMVRESPSVAMVEEVSTTARALHTQDGDHDNSR